MRLDFNFIHKFFQYLNIYYYLQKFVLILNIAKQFWKILVNKQRYPNYVMSFHKRDLLNIETIRNRNVKDRIVEVNLNSISDNFSKLEILGKDNGIYSIILLN